MGKDEIFRKFPDEATCIGLLERLRWQGRPICPYCKSARTSPIREENRHRCNNCSTAFSVTARTVFHKTHLPLRLWFVAIVRFFGEAKRISARKLASELGVNKNTAWYLLERIQRATKDAENRKFLEIVLAGIQS